MSVVTRFPPSPTGFMHIGNARTAIYNWLYARHNGGKMLFRIEDTDRARHSEEAALALINGLEWLGLDWDGDIVSQFKRQKRHAEVAQELLDKGKAWKCYYTQEELQKLREEAGGYKLPRYVDIKTLEESGKLEPSQTESYTIRIMAPFSGVETIPDLVQGEVQVQNSELDDFVLLRSDGTPTYMLSVVVDDHDMGVTHVIRGDDHLNNTFRQKNIFDAMGWDIPEYAHLPLIHGPDGGKMSKRHGGATLEEYRDLGYLPEAVFNYLLRLGWSHGDDEIISREQAIEWFDLAGVGKSAAKFDLARLESLNSHYISQADNGRLLELAMPFIQERHGVDPDETAQKRILASMEELKDRAKTLIQLADESAFYAKTIPYDFDEKANTILQDSADEVLDLLLQRLGMIDDFSGDAIMTVGKEIADELRGGKLGKVGMPMRAALTGTAVSPSIFHAAAILGKEETLARLEYARTKCVENKGVQTASAN